MLSEELLPSGFILTFNEDAGSVYLEPEKIKELYSLAEMANNIIRLNIGIAGVIDFRFPDY